MITVFLGWSSTASITKTAQLAGWVIIVAATGDWWRERCTIERGRGLEEAES